MSVPPLTLLLHIAELAKVGLLENLAWLKIEKERKVVWQKVSRFRKLTFNKIDKKLIVNSCAASTLIFYFKITFQLN